MYPCATTCRTDILGYCIVVLCSFANALYKLTSIFTMLYPPNDTAQPKKGQDREMCFPQNANYKDLQKT